MTGVDDALARMQEGVDRTRRFVDDMRAQGIHVGVGTGADALCAVCDTTWPCEAVQSND